MNCFVCFNGDSVGLELDLGSFSMDVALCKKCFKQLLDGDHYLTMCQVCGGFGVVSKGLISEISGRNLTPTAGKINIVFLNPCRVCGGNLDELIGHA